MMRGFIVLFSGFLTPPDPENLLGLLWGWCWVFQGSREAGRASYGGGGGGAEAAQVHVSSCHLVIEETSVHKRDRYSCMCGAHTG